MAQKRSFCLLFIGCVLLGVPPFFSVTLANETFPFLAEVAVENVNIRAGQDTNFESLGCLNRGSEVVVVGKSYNWYKIKLPLEAKVYISQEYAQMVDPAKAVVMRDRVNVRAGAGTKFSVLGQLNQGTFVKVLEKLEGWYKIEPVEGIYGWVGVQFVTFKSDRIPDTLKIQTAGVERSSTSVLSPQAPTIDPSSRKTSESTTGESALPVPSPFYIGRLEELKGSFPNDDIRYQLTRPDGMTYYLKGEQWIFEEFSGYQVKVEGKFVNGTRHDSHPVLEVQSIRLVF